MRGLSRSTPMLGIGVAIAVAMLACVACTSATGEVRGGEPRYDSAAPDPLVVPITEETFADAPPTTWRALYRDFFGRRSKASCAGNGNCHGEGASGARSTGFVCEDADACWESLRTGRNPDPRVSTRALVEEADIPSPENAYLFKVLRFRTADGQLVANRGMPQQPRDFAYTPDDIQRIQAWIEAGAKND